MKITKLLILLVLLLPLSGCYKTFLYVHRDAVVNACSQYHAHPENYSQSQAERAQRECDEIAQYEHEIQTTWVPI